MKNIRRWFEQFKETRDVCKRKSHGHLIVLDFFFWGRIKNVVYAEKIRAMQHPKDRICAVFESVTPEMILGV
jgi:hypothetical protein